MNKENLEFLQDSLRYLGFGERASLNQQLEQMVASEAKEFVLESEVYYDDETKLEVILCFRRSEQLDMYFFNKYEAKLCFADNPDRDRKHMFYISKGSGITLREAYNLLQGRAVNKDLTNAEGMKYNAWIQLNFEEKDSFDYYKVKTFRVQYGYSLEKTLEKYPIRELKNEELRNSLIKSLKKGNIHTVSFEKSNKNERMLIEANPQYKTINIYSMGSRGRGKSPVKQDQETGETDSPEPEKKNYSGTKEEGPEEREDREDREDMEGREDMKEEELELPGGKRPAKKRS
jgi:hypothetical protein